MDHDELTDRIHALGEHPVPEATRRGHLHRMSLVATGREKRFGRLAVAGAAIVGFLAGSTGLAMAGALPAPAQDVAHDVLAVVQVDVPEGHRGSCVSRAAKIEDPVEKQAAKDACPKGGRPPWAGQPGADGRPGRSGEAPGKGGAGPHVDDPCRGRPPWAGPGLTPDEREQRKADHAAARAAAGCPMDAEPEAEDPEPGS